MKKPGAGWVVELAVALVGTGVGHGYGSAEAKKRLVPRNWGYQLQGYGLAGLRDSMFDVLVVDYSTTGGADGELTPAQVRALRQDGPCGTRTVLAYFSIGEAEDYRYYFRQSWLGPDGQPGTGAPAWLGATNPDWEGNYKVRYWQKAWQRILWGKRRGSDKSYLDRVIDAGFDGVYLDIIDAFEYWGPRENDGNDEKRDSAQAMVTFVKKLARYARRKRGVKNFLVVPQNGAGIIADWSYPDATNPEKEAAKQRRRYFRNIDAIGAEEVFYSGNRDENNPFRPRKYRLELLDQFASAGRTVLVIDYLTDRAKTDRFWGAAVSRGYVPYVSRRDLDRLTIPAGHAPACRQGR
jgi:cysteinyl-tRNA synthetase